MDIKREFRDFLNEAKIKRITKWKNFVSKSIDGTGGWAYLFTNGKWDTKPTDMVKYLKDNPEKGVIFRQSGVKYEWALDTGIIEYL